MRVLVLPVVGFSAIVTASPGFAQMVPGNPGRPAAERIFDDRMQTRDAIAREVSEFRRMTDADLIKSAEAYQTMTEPHRANALQIAAQAKSAGLPADAGPRIRGALEADLNAWREAFRVSRRDWDAMRKQWLVDANSLTGQQWAEQRANWFAARDVWITRRMQKANALRR